MTGPTALAYPRVAAERRTAVALILLVLLAARILSLLAARTDLFFDEAQYWTWSQDLAFGYFSKPPLIAWIIRATTSVCGDGEACVRLSAPLLYFGTSILVYVSARELFDESVGLASALVFATLPGVSFSSTQMSTDVPLLFFYSLALLAWVKLLRTRRTSWALILGAAFGLGMLAKYAMIYFLLGAVVHLTASRQARRDFPRGGAVLSALVAALIIAPHFLWNYRNGFVTLGHTAANASWDWDMFHPDRFLEFFGAQFGVFGPVLFGALLLIAWRARRGATDETRTLLLSFSLPVLILISVQAILSRAYANWAATAYPAATILVTAALLQRGWIRLFRFSLGLHLIVALVIVVVPAFAPWLRLPRGIDPFSRQLGWRETAEIVRGELARRPYAMLLAEDRQVTAELLYYLRDTTVPLTAWRWSDLPDDHFELNRPFRGAEGAVLLVTPQPDRDSFLSRFRSAELVLEQPVSAGAMKTRRISLYRLEGYDEDGS
jgi:4-amino-4-deoxy-L-arabinose transferase-like glycosyltransferase